MSKRTLSNLPTNKDYKELIDKIKSKRRRADSYELVRRIGRIKKVEPVVWGSSIIGFGRYEYQRKDGSKHQWFNVGCSVNQNRITLYLMYDIQKEESLLNELGDFLVGKGCLYFKYMDNLNEDILDILIEKSNRWAHHTSL